ncbi:response regulator transcription factor [Nocardia miyunensis]|uniref:response regulator transcription factor n=1 Tax=Nocardia miyunensis TaxID=282684 RepID=UPI00082F251E|nr:response regulator transcription factor [Nocardia miyunensis]
MSVTQSIEYPQTQQACPEARILIIDDEPMILDLLAAALRYQGFEVITASTGTEGLDLVCRVRPDAMLLDVMMPDMDGFGLLKRLRQDGIDVPVLFLTARNEVQDKVAGLMLGADDYVAKPFSLEEVVARVRVILRRVKPFADDRASLKVGDIELDVYGHLVWKAGRPVRLSPTEFALLRYFMRYPGTVLSKDRLLEDVWHYEFGRDTGLVESYISFLRRKVDTTDPKMLCTLRGVGYVLRAPASDSN